MSQVGSPKFGSATPSRVRHNPYAASPSSPTLGTPTTGKACPMTPPSLSNSFASATPLTPPIAAAPPATWGSPTLPAVAQLPADGASAFSNAFQSRDQSFAANDSFPTFVPHSEGLNLAAAYVEPPAFYADAFQPAYEAVDPALAVMMYSAASAAANAAAAGHGQFDYAQMHQGAQGQQRRDRRGGGNAAAAEMTAAPTFEEIQAMQGMLVEQARTASGSSYIQAAVKDNNDPRCLDLVWAELSPALGDLLLDAHGCYVIKTLLERLPPQQVAFVLQCIAADEQLGFSICTHSLHTRRVVQHIIENLDGGFLCDLMSRHCADVAMTQQGCIVMQRSMDHAPPGLARDRLFAAISTNLITFAKDPFANYVVQHLMEVGERVETSTSMWKCFRGRVVELACNKFASNVIEKCLFHCTADIQHEMLVEMYSVGPQMLYNMLQDSFGNYIIQSSIALATFRDINFIDERLRPVLAHTPYGHKIEGRLDRRLKGKPVTARGPTPQGAPAAGAAAPNQPRSNGGNRSNNRRADKVPAGEVPW